MAVPRWHHRPGRCALGSGRPIRDRMPGDDRRRHRQALGLIAVAARPTPTPIEQPPVDAVALELPPRDDATLLGLDERTRAAVFVGRALAAEGAGLRVGDHAERTATCWVRRGDWQPPRSGACGSRTGHELTPPDFRLGASACAPRDDASSPNSRTSISPYFNLPDWRRSAREALGVGDRRRSPRSGARRCRDQSGRCLDGGALSATRGARHRPARIRTGWPRPPGRATPAVVDPARHTEAVTRAPSPSSTPAAQHPPFLSPPGRSCPR